MFCRIICPIGALAAWCRCLLRWGLSDSVKGLQLSKVLCFDKINLNSWSYWCRWATILVKCLVVLHTRKEEGCAWGLLVKCWKGEGLCFEQYREQKGAVDTANHENEHLNNYFTGLNFSIFNTDLNRIQTPHILFWDFGADFENLSFKFLSLCSQPAWWALSKNCTKRKYLSWNLVECNNLMY